MEIVTGRHRVCYNELHGVLQQESPVATAHGGGVRIFFSPICSFAALRMGSCLFYNTHTKVPGVSAVARKFDWRACSVAGWTPFYAMRKLMSRVGGERICVKSRFSKFFNSPFRNSHLRWNCKTHLCNRYSV